MAGQGSGRRRSIAVTVWAVAVALGMTAGLLVIGRLTPGRPPTDSTAVVGVVPVPGRSADDGAETARVLLPSGTPRRSFERPDAGARSAAVRLRIPALGVDSAVVEGVDLASLADGVGHWPGTAQPGEPGNMVIAGHRTTHGAPFRRLDELEGGDEVILGTEGAEVTYRVTGTEIVSPGQVDVARPTANATATLFACHPPGSARQRIVARLEATG